MAGRKELLSALLALGATLCLGHAASADWYVKGATGNDHNNGRTPSTPRMSMHPDELVSDGETIFVAEQVRDFSGAAPAVSYRNKTGVAIQQWVGQPRADIRADTQTGTGWTPLGQTRYS